MFRRRTPPTHGWLMIGLLGLLLAGCQVTAPPGVDTTAPDTPSGLSVQAGNGQATLTWDANSESDLDHYNVYQGTVSGNLTKVAEVAAGSGPFTATGLTNGVTYLFAIDAWDDSDNQSDQTAEVATTPVDATAPDTPSGLSVQAGNGQATLTWDANSESDLDHYNVYQGTVSGNLTKVAEVAAGSGPFTATGLTNGVTYLFAIDAWDDSDNQSDQTAEVAVTPSATAPIVCVFGDAAALFGSCVFAP